MKKLAVLISILIFFIGPAVLGGENVKVPLSAVKDKYVSKLDTQQLTKQKVTVPKKWVVESYFSKERNPQEKTLNNQSHRIGTEADPEIVTLGPKKPVYRPEWDPYEGKYSINFDLARKKPVLAPVDMKLIGFKNGNSEYVIYEEGYEGDEEEKDAPVDNLQLWFRSLDQTYPRMVVHVYHLFSSPILEGQMINEGCIRHESWHKDRPHPQQGHVFYSDKDYHTNPTGDASSCEPLMGKTVERGQVIGYGGTMGDHGHIALGFKVYDEKVNPTVTRGNEHLHWVQPGAYFDWKCYDPDAEFSDKVLAYPFECGGYRVAPKKRDPYFKYEN